MKLNAVNRLYLYLLVLWFLINLAQAIFTGIHYDEVYYAMWGKNLAWGYFDHPPAVALLTYLGSIFFEGNLSIRFFTVVLHLFTLTLIWNTINEKYRQTSQSVWLFFIVVSSLTMLSVYGFTTTPDTPLMFFMALFLFGYRKFLEEKMWRNVLLLSIAMAGMLYSKYHGVLIIGIVVLSNFKLLLNVRFWLAGISALLFLVPHLWWQYIHDFSSFKFHLSVRSLGFAWQYVLEFIPGQLGVFNPFVLGGVIFLLWKYRKPQSDFERALYFLIVGIVGFFALSTYRGRAEAHWTSVASIPMVILLVEKALQDEKLKRYILKYISYSLLLIVGARIVLLTDLSEIFGYKDRGIQYRQIEAVAGNTPVVFNVSFQDACAYEFYTKKVATTISSMENRQTQYDLWQKEQEMLGKKVFIVLGKDDGRLKHLASHQYNINEHYSGVFVDDWQVSNRLNIHYDLPKKQFKKGEEVEISIEIENPTKHLVDFNHKKMPVELKVVFLILKREYEVENAQFSLPLESIKSSQKIKGKLKFKIPENLETRVYKFSVITHSLFGNTINGAFEEIEVKE